MLSLLFLFIAVNSLIPGDISETESQSVAYFIFRNSEVMSVTMGQLPWILAHAIIRKIGHFLEYACLGMLLLFYETMKLQEDVREPADVISLRVPFMIQLLRTGLLIGLMDESLQLLAPGRWGSIMDIWIDTLGFALGVLVT